MDNYKKYRWFYTSSGKLVLGGKSAKQNDELLHQLKKKDEDRIVSHTSEPGSPFCVILANLLEISQSDIQETAVFTGCFSRAWREGKNSAKVDIFKLSQVHKDKTMKEGTWGVYGKVKRITIPLELVITRQDNIIRAIPEHSLLKNSNYVKICPGSLSKEDMLPKLEIELNEPLSKDEVISALPTGGFKINRS